MAKILISSLGYRAFEPADDAKSSAHNASEPPQPGEEPLLYLNAQEASRKGGGQATDSSPSKIRSCEQNWSIPRLLQCVWTERGPLTSSNSLTGASTSGKTAWKTHGGVTLRDLEAAELKATAGEM
ncbi:MULTISPECIES: hypothetical protein [Corynebacterium]|uniref:Uncharacterized protein n=1 Tax=Corynebacterium lipophilum TaxID=2804918 RepID=A0AAW5HVI0_9CORY|nr:MULTISPECIES: hypothetical protein [Corynebacterium]MCO6395500.1 hypothetical protein [Corynebacterium lipophilum]MCZ2118219.1 hypothetical protein [Corynebacterium lipophilum]OIR41769.1 hypothetical protein BJP06_09660 [Corynebacterium sp. NML120713]